MFKKKFDRLKLLKIIAFFMVFFLHAKIFIPVTWFENIGFAWILFTPAWAGVWIFFVLSGYGIGCGFYSGKYQMSFKGILKYYYSRLIKVLPLYWTYIFLLVFFLKPEYLLPGHDSIGKLIRLLLFCYQEEFDSIEFGLAWYMTTLMRLYFIAPLFYFLVKRYLNNRKFVKWIFLCLAIGGFLLRIMMGYHIECTGEGNWSANIYKPFYFNLDLFFSGFILNGLKGKKVKLKTISYFPWIGLIILILYNNYIYFYASYYGTSNLNIYCYILPSIYLLYICFMICNYDVFFNKDKEKETIKGGVIYSLAQILMPLYLFHSTILLCMKNGYKESWYMRMVEILKIPSEYSNFAIGLFFTMISLIYTIVVAYLLYFIIMIPLNSKLDKFCKNKIGTWMKGKTRDGMDSNE